MDTWNFKKESFKADGQVVYAGYFLGKFHGYFYKEKRYQLQTVKKIKGAIQKEKFIGYGYAPFFLIKNEDSTYQTWEEWKTHHKNFVNEI